MKFLSDILAKAGLTVDGVVTLNNTATGQTPNANDNSTKLATTAWVRTFVQPYSLPIATASILGGIKVGEGLSINATTGVLSTVGGASITSFRSEYIITATAGQTTFTVPNGYTPGKIDLFLNGVYLNDTIYTATNSSTIVLDDAAALDDILTVFVYSTYYVGDSPSARTTTYFTATNNQTVFTVDYVIGQVDIFYNGSKLEPSEYTANNGTSITLLTPATTGDKIEVVNWAVGGGIAATRTITIDGVAQDLTANRTWNILPTGGAAGDILAKTSATNYAVAWIPNYTSTVQHTVKAAVALTAGQAVYVSSADGTNMIVSKASNASEQTSSKTLGLVAQNLAINGQGFVVTEGLLAGLDTTGANAAGDPVWLGTDGNLIYGLANKPVAPAHLVFIGVVTRRNANNGEIFVKVQNGFEFNELHDLSVASPSDGDMIKYVASTGLWTKIAATTTNIAEGTNLYYTNTRSRTAISLTTSGTSGAATYDNATGVINIPQYQGGVTSFNTRTGAITLSSSDVTTALTYTPVTNARTLTINGTTYDLSADRSWSIASGVTSFNTRTGAISLTSLDVTDALTYTPVTNARTLTINGTSYDLSANRSWTIAPDTSVRNIYGFTATANQTTFTVSGGYTVGLVDVFINGVKLAAADFTATNGTTVVLGTGTGVGNIVEIIKYVSAFTTAQEALNGTGLVRMSGTTVSYDNATYATQSYVTTAVANLVNAAPSTLDTLNELAAALGNDANFATTITTSIGTKQPQLNGTGFVKISGTTISYDNNTYLTTASASSTYALDNAVVKLTGTQTIGGAKTFSNVVTASSDVTSRTALNVITLSNTEPYIFLGRNDSSNGIGVIRILDGGILAFDNGATGASQSTKFSIASTGAATFNGGSANIPLQMTSSSSNGTILGLINTSGSTYSWGINAYTNGNLYFQYGTLGSGSNPFYFTSAGAANFSSTLSATTGYFSGNVVIDNTSLNNPKFLQFDANISSGANAVLGDIRWYNKQWDSSIKAQIVALTDTNITNGRLSFRTGTDGVNAIERLRISCTGESTFTSLVTAPTFYSTVRSNTIDTDDGVSNNYQGYGGYWALRTDLNNNFNLDVYGNGTPKNALFVSQVTGAATFSSSIQIGSTPATITAGLAIGIPNDYAIRWRNAGNTGNVGMYLSGGNQFVFDTSVYANGEITSTSHATFGSATSTANVRIYSNGSPFAIFGSTGYARGFIGMTWDVNPDRGLIVGNELRFNTNAIAGTTIGSTALTITSNQAASFSGSVNFNSQGNIVAKTSSVYNGTQTVTIGPGSYNGVMQIMVGVYGNGQGSQARAMWVCGGYVGSGIGFTEITRVNGGSITISALTANAGSCTFTVSYSFPNAADISVTVIGTNANTSPATITIA